jgi:DNA ligase-1
MASREFLQLAKKFVLGKDDPSGMFISEKLDGTRVFWDGGISRGVATVDVPWANINHPKTGELKTNIKLVATGLWSRYGNPVIAPDWWLNRLPQIFLDGELFAGRGNFQSLRSIVAKKVAVDEAWQDVQFAVFGCPPVEHVFAPGEIKNPNMVLNIDPTSIMKFIKRRAESGATMLDINQMDVMKVIERHWGKGTVEGSIPAPHRALTFEHELSYLQLALPQDEMIYLHRHVQLPGDRSGAEDHMGRFMDEVLGEGGEGIMLRDPQSIWTPKRVNSLLKLKPFTDDQGTLIGFVSGRQTDKGSKLRGLIGAMILDYKGKRLEMSGFTDEERRFADEEMTSHAYNNPGEEMPPHFQGQHFSVGDTIEFRYRELSDDGIPKEARFLRHV